MTVVGFCEQPVTGTHQRPEGLGVAGAEVGVELFCVMPERDLNVASGWVCRHAENSACPGSVHGAIFRDVCRQILLPVPVSAGRMPVLAPDQDGVAAATASLIAVWKWMSGASFLP